MNSNAFNVKESLTGEYFNLEISQSIWKECRNPPLLSLAILNNFDCDLNEKKIIATDSIRNISDSAIISLQNSKQVLIALYSCFKTYVISSSSV